MGGIGIGTVAYGFEVTELSLGVISFSTILRVYLLFFFSFFF
jgi:hypothetical protein